MTENAGRVSETVYVAAKFLGYTNGDTREGAAER